MPRYQQADAKRRNFGLEWIMTEQKEDRKSIWKKMHGEGGPRITALSPRFGYICKIPKHPK